MKSIGMVETNGLVAAIECLDVMVKSSNVKILKKIHIGSGLVTVLVSGDVGSVKAAIDAAEYAIKNLDKNFLFSTHVIPNPNEELNQIFDLETSVIKPKIIKEFKEPKAMKESENIECSKKMQVSETDEELEEIENFKINKTLIDKLILTQENKKIEEILRRLKINDLRKVLREYDQLNIKNKEISKLNRQKLIETILSCYN